MTWLNIIIFALIIMGMLGILHGSVLYFVDLACEKKPVLVPVAQYFAFVCCAGIVFLALNVIAEALIFPLLVVAKLEHLVEFMRSGVGAFVATLWLILLSLRIELWIQTHLLPMGQLVAGIFLVVFGFIAMIRN